MKINIIFQRKNIAFRLLFCILTVFRSLDVYFTYHFAEDHVYLMSLSMQNRLVNTKLKIAGKWHIHHISGWGRVILRSAGLSFDLNSINYVVFHGLTSFWLPFSFDNPKFGFDNICENSYFCTKNDHHVTDMSFTHWGRLQMNESTETCLAPTCCDPPPSNM